MGGSDRPADPDATPADTGTARSYRRLLLFGWSRREWLSVVVVAVTTAFLVGSTLLLVTVGGYTATLEDDLAGTATVDAMGVEAARTTADGNDVVLPYAVVRVDGDRRLLVGVPPDAPPVVDGASVAWKQARLPQPGANVTGAVDVPRRHTLRGARDTATATVRPHASTDSLFPEWWYVANASLVDRLGPSGAFVVDPDAPGGGLDAGVPLLAALPFLVAGIDELVRTLSVAVLAGALIVLVLVFSVSRMAIRDNIRTIRVARATGAPPGRLFALLVARSGLLTVGGVALGAGVGVATTLAAIRIADLLGVPVSLSPALTPGVARTVGPLLGALVGAGVVAGAGAAVSAIRPPPGRLGVATGGAPRRAGATERGGRPVGRGRRLARWRRIRARIESGSARFWERVEPTVLGTRTVLPTTVSLTVFVLIVLLLGAYVGSFAPLTTTQSGTVMEAGATNPLNSRISVEYASLLRERGVEASPEVLYAQVRDGQPYLVRGANYSAFVAVTDVTLTAGRPPDSPDEAVVGESLARTLDLRRGDAITLGGSVSPGIRRVTVVGVYDGPHVFDDQLLVPLETIAGLSSAPGTVHVVRTEGLDRGTWRNLTSGGPPVLVTGLSAPERVTDAEPYNATVAVRNLNDTAERTTVSLATPNGTIDRAVTLEPGAERRVTFELGPSAPGTYRLSAASYETTVTVVPSEAFVLPAELPDRSPPGALIQIPAVTGNGTTVAGATVTVGSFSAPTDASGVAAVPVPDEPGRYPVEVSKPGYRPAATELVVERGARRRLGGRLTVSPQTGGVFTRPQLTVTLANPWGRPLERNLTLVTPGGAETRHARLNPGNVSRLRLDADEAGFPDRVPPGEYPIRLLSDGHELAATTYTVEGDAQSFRAVAGAGTYARGTGISRAIESVFGNVQVLFATMFLLAGLSSIGATTATFARAVQVRKTTLGVYRATGASRRRLLWILAGDAVRLALPAAAGGVLLASSIMWAFDALGFLQAFGIQLDVPLTPAVILASVCGAVALAVVGALAAGWVFLRATPGDLLRPS